jgi:aconitate hydratase
MISKNSLNVIKKITISGKEYKYFSLNEAAKELGIDLKKLPFSLRILFENILRNEDGNVINKAKLENFVKWLQNKKSDEEILYYPARVLMQDFTGVPAVVDLAAMRESVKKHNGDPKAINPVTPVDLVIDHSVQVDSASNADSLKINTSKEFQRNYERYQFLKWGKDSFDNFRVVPPGAGICHQVNLEFLANVVNQKNIDKQTYLIPDTLVGTDSHTTMVNGIGVAGWGVGGIEAEAAMLGEGLSMLIPEVIGVKITGQLPEGVTATDLVLTVTEILRKKIVVGKFIEFYGDGLTNLSVADRATISNMCPEYGATCSYFPIDAQTIRYLDNTGRTKEQIEIIKAYCKEQSLWQDYKSEAEYSDIVELNLASIRPSLAGPRKPQDRSVLEDVPANFQNFFKAKNLDLSKKFQAENKKTTLSHGDIAIAAITSCTNTSNPAVMIAAGLVAKNAYEKNLKIPEFVKTSLAPGSKVVTQYLDDAGLTKYLDKMGFNLVGYGCTTCIGNSGPLDQDFAASIKENDIHICSVLSGNRNFEGRIHPLVKASYLASPPLVVAYAIAGNINYDIVNSPLGKDKNGKDVFLKDIWPTDAEINKLITKLVTREIFTKKYQDVFQGEEEWQNIKTEKSETYDWEEKSTYIRNPTFFDNLFAKRKPHIKDARVLAMFADSITTDHISPAGNIAGNSPAARYLAKQGTAPQDFNSYGSRRGNHEVMMRGTFANIRIKNEILKGKEGGDTKHFPTGEELSIYDAAMGYQQDNTDLVIIAGELYGAGSSRDWAAKGTLLLGVKAVIAESFERIHRSNLVGMGVLPLMFTHDINRKSLNLTGEEIINIKGLENLTPHQEIQCHIKYQDGNEIDIPLIVRIDTDIELKNYQNGGILNKVIKEILEEK